MKRLSLLGFVAVLASALAGCPIYDNEDHHGFGVGGSGGGTGCIGAGCPTQCTQPSDCPVNETCGADGQCHTGDCTI